LTNACFGIGGEKKRVFHGERVGVREDSTPHEILEPSLLDTHLLVDGQAEVVRLGRELIAEGGGRHSTQAAGEGCDVVAERAERGIRACGSHQHRARKGALVPQRRRAGQKVRARQHVVVDDSGVSPGVRVVFDRIAVEINAMFLGITSTNRHLREKIDTIGGAARLGLKSAKRIVGDVARARHEIFTADRDWAHGHRGKDSFSFHQDGIELEGCRQKLHDQRARCSRPMELDHAALIGDVLKVDLVDPLRDDVERKVPFFIGDAIFRLIDDDRYIGDGLFRFVVDHSAMHGRRLRPGGGTLRQQQDQD